ncbi:MAG: extracellular solute-binding protein [Thermomicrobiales bacterium]|nr:extracellular solute-binding protein [Thermomicrobiales bacterium]
MVTHRTRYLSRRSLMKGAGALALGVSARSLLRGPVTARQTPTTRNIEGTELKILLWQHFVPVHDAWFSAFVEEWGAANGVTTQVDYINTAEVPTTFAAEIAAQEGHDLVEHIASLGQYEKSLVDMTSLIEEAKSRHGEMSGVCARSGYNPTTGVNYSFVHGYAPDPGDYRKSLWDTVELPNGPTTWQELLDGGTRIKAEQGIQLGIGMSNEIDSNMAGQALLWAFDASVQDASENVTINSSETIAALDFMKQLYDGAMTPEVFGWNAASNNQLLVAGQASYILNSISAYRAAMEQNPEVAKDIFFSYPLAGPNGTALANGHAVYNAMIPNYSPNQDTAAEFILHLVNNYEAKTRESLLYDFPGFPSIAPDLLADGGWLDVDPFGSDPVDKLTVLKTANDYTTNIGHPGPANAVLGSVFGEFVLPNMFARVARGEQTSAESAAEAEAQINAFYEQWAAEGLVGGGR